MMKSSRSRLEKQKVEPAPGKERLFLDAGGEGGYQSIVLFCKNGVSLQLSVDEEQLLNIEMLGPRGKGASMEEKEMADCPRLCDEESGVEARLVEDAGGRALVVFKNGKPFWRTPLNSEHGIGMRRGRTIRVHGAPGQ